MGTDGMNSSAALRFLQGARVFATLVLYAGGLAVADDCSFYARTGAKVTPRSGTCTMADGKSAADDRSKSGLERCVDKEKARTLSEISWRDGKRNGPAFYHDYNDRKIVATFKNDLAEGTAQIFAKDGYLLCDMQFSAGVGKGALREYFRSGKLKLATLMEERKSGARIIRLTEDGKVRELRCADKSMVPEDVVPCGFNGAESRVQLHDDRGEPIRNIQTWRDGKLIKMETVDRKGMPVLRTFPTPGDEDSYDEQVTHKTGKVAKTFSVRKGNLEGPLRDYSEEGTLLSEVVYEREHPRAEKLYYMNGKLKRNVERAAEGGRLKREEYWDNGTLKSTGTYQDPGGGNWEYLDPDGVVQEYSKQGVLLSESNFAGGFPDGNQKLYHASGKLAIEEEYQNKALVKLKCYDLDGKLEFSEEYFADGSRKVGTEMSEEEKERRGVCKAARK